MNFEDTLIQLFVAAIFLVTVCLHVVKKNVSEAWLYGVQSLMVVLLLLASSWNDLTLPVAFIVLVTMIVKVVMAPSFFVRMIRRHSLRFSASSYASVPVSMIGIALIVILANSNIMTPIVALSHGHNTAMVLALASMLSSIFLMVNRKGALSQLVGVLSIENSIVVCGILAGLEQSAILQVGILFDIAAWLVISNVFLSMMYHHMGSLDVTVMKHLKD